MHHILVQRRSNVFIQDWTTDRDLSLVLGTRLTGSFAVVS